MAADEMYGMDDGAGAGSDSPEPQAQDEGMHKEDKEEYGETALLPKSFFGGKQPKPGEEWIVEIVHDHGDEVEVKYATGKGDKGSGSEGEMAEGPEMDKADQKLQSMAY